MGRQALRDAVVRDAVVRDAVVRDAVVRHRAEGLAGLRDRPRGRPPRRLAPQEEAEPTAACLARPRSCRGRRLAPGRAPISAAGSSGASAGPVAPRAWPRCFGRLGFSRETGAAPSPSARCRGARQALEEGGSARGWPKPPSAIATSGSSCGSRSEPGWRTVRWTVFPANARVGSKGRACQRWWRRGPSARRAAGSSASCGPPSSPRSAPPRARTSPWCFAPSMPRRVPGPPRSRRGLAPTGRPPGARRGSRPPDSFPILLAPRRRRPAPEPRPRRARQRHPRRPAAPGSSPGQAPRPRAQPGGARPAPPARALPLAAPPTLDQRHRRRPARDAWMRLLAERDRLRPPCSYP